MVFGIRRKTSVARSIEREAFEMESLKQAKLTGTARAKARGMEQRSSSKRAGGGGFRTGLQTIGGGLAGFSKDVARSQQAQQQSVRRTQTKRLVKPARKTRRKVIRRVRKARQENMFGGGVF